MRSETSPLSKLISSAWAVKAFAGLITAGALLTAGSASAAMTLGTNLIDITQVTGNETDPSVAINPLNPSNYVVVSASDAPMQGLFVTVTTNLGLTFVTNFIATNNSPNLPPAAGDLSYPSVAFDSFGNLFLAYIPDDFLGVAIDASTNGGLSFFAMTNLADLDSADQPRITAPPSGAAAGSAWVVYKDYTSPGSPLQVQGLISTGLGAIGTFGLEQFISDSTNGGFADISVGPLGQVMVAFQDNMDGSQGSFSDIWVSVETNAITNGVISDAGFIPSQPIAFDAISGVTYRPAAPNGIGLNAAPGLAWDFNNDTNFDNVYLVYTAWGFFDTNPPTANTVISFMSSSDYGTNGLDEIWSQESYVDDDATNGYMGSFNDHFLPHMSVDPTTGNIGFGWYDCRNDLGSASTPVTNYYTNTFTYANPVTNISFVNSSGLNFTTETWIDQSGGKGTKILVNIVADNINSSSITSDLISNIFVGTNTGPNIDIQTGTETNAASATVEVDLVDVFPQGYSSGKGSGNTAAIMYATQSTNGGQSFDPNVQLNPPNQQILSPATGIASAVANTSSLTGWGHYSGLAAYGASYFWAWSDNSDATTNNPSGALKQFDVYMLTAGPGQPGGGNPVSDLSVFVTNSPTSTNIISDQTLIYYVIATNSGPKTAKPVTLTDVLSPYVTLEKVVPALGVRYSTGVTTNGLREIIFDIPSMSVKEVLTNIIFVDATTSDLDTNVATISSPLINLTPTNTVWQNVVLVGGEDLAIGVNTSETNVLIGDTVVSTITVTNFGPATNGPVYVTNYFSPAWGGISVLAQGTNLVTTNANGPMVIMDLGLLPVDKPVTATIFATALSYGPSAWESNVVTSQDYDTNLQNNFSSSSFVVNGEDLAIGMVPSTNFVNLGQPVTFTMEVTNLGLSYSGAVVVTNNLSANLGQISASQSQGTSIIGSNQVVFSLGTLGAGEVATLSISAVPTGGPSSAGSSANVSSPNFDPNLANNTTSNSLTINGENLVISVSATNKVAVGQTVTFSESVTNLGASTNGIVMVTNTFSSQFGSIAVVQPASGYVINGRTVTLNLGMLNVNQVVPITLTAIATAAGTGTDTGTVGSTDFATSTVNTTNKASITITNPPPAISNLVVKAYSTSAFITWNTSSPATDQVKYGFTASYGSFTSISVNSATSHAVLLSGLAPGSNYDFQAVSYIGTNIFTTNGAFSLQTNPVVILNTGDAHYTGNWSESQTAPGIYDNGYYQYTSTTVFNATSWAIYDPTIPLTGLYNVFIWHPANSTFATNAQVYIIGPTNEVVDSIDESVNGGSWQLLDTNLYITTGTNASVILYNDTGDTSHYLVANAMMWAYNQAQDYPTSGTVPPWWANFYFGTNANGTPPISFDANGNSMYADYVFGLNPTNAASQLSFTVTQSGSNTASVIFSPYQNARAYELQAAAGLAAPVWVTLTNTPVQAASTGAGVFNVTETNGASRFYRLSAQAIP